MRPVWNAANLLTVSRMVLALAILFTRPFSAGFYALYALCGVTDMADGPVARRTGTASELGAPLRRRPHTADFSPRLRRGHLRRHPGGVLFCREAALILPPSCSAPGGGGLCHAFILK